MTTSEDLDARNTVIAQKAIDAITEQRLAVKGGLFAAKQLTAEQLTDVLAWVYEQKQLKCLEADAVRAAMHLGTIGQSSAAAWNADRAEDTVRDRAYFLASVEATSFERVLRSRLVSAAGDPVSAADQTQIPVS